MSIYSAYGAWPEIFQGIGLKGYCILQGFPIIQLLYYISAIAETTSNLPETLIGSLLR